MKNTPQTHNDKAIDLKGWSHASPVFRQKVLWYPWEDDFRRIYFFAKNRTQAAIACDRLNLLVRDLDGGSNSPALIPSKLKALREGK